MDEKTKRTLIRSGVGIFTVGAGAWLANRKMPLLAAGLLIWFLPNVVYRYNRAIWETSGYYQAQKEIKELRTTLVDIQTEDKKKLDESNVKLRATLVREETSQQLIFSLQHSLKQCQERPVKVETKEVIKETTKTVETAPPLATYSIVYSNWARVIPEQDFPQVMTVSCVKTSGEKILVSYLYKISAIYEDTQSYDTVNGQKDWMDWNTAVGYLTKDIAPKICR